MTTRLIGEPVERREDARLLTGRARFIDDIHLPGMLHAAVLRSPHAKARFTRIDARAALALPGVHAVITHEDLGSANAPMPLLNEDPGFIHPRTHQALAPGQVRFVGEAVALVVADSRYLAEDALDLIAVDYAPEAAAVDLVAAAEPGAPLVHDDTDSNIACRTADRSGDIESAFAAADFVLREELRPERGAAQPMETRGVVARYDASLDQLTIWDTTQAPVAARGVIAEKLGTAGGRDHRDRAGRGRRLRRQDLPGLPGGTAHPLRGPPARPPDQVDRGPPRALHRLQPRAADGAPHRSGRVEGRAHPRDQGPLPLRQRRLLPLRPHQCPVRPGHSARPLQDSGGAHGIRGRLHQHPDREPLPRRGPAARRLRHGNGHEPRRPCARPRCSRDQAAQSGAARGLPLGFGPHLPGQHAAHSPRQRLSRPAREDSRRTRLRGREAQPAGGARAGNLPRRRHCFLCRGHRHLALRGRRGAGGAHRPCARDDRLSLAGAGPSHDARAGGGGDPEPSRPSRWW